MVAGSFRTVAIKIRDVIRVLEEHGWRLARTRGSHRQYKHPDHARLVTIPGKPGDDLSPGMLKSIVRNAGFSAVVFRRRR